MKLIKKHSARVFQSAYLVVLQKINIVKTEDLEFLKRFLSRMPMYVGKVKKQNIICFLHGYDCSRFLESEICETISNYLEKNHKIYRRNLGWSYQIELLKNKRKSTWIKTFKTILKEIIEKTEPEGELNLKTPK